MALLTFVEAEVVVSPILHSPESTVISIKILLLKRLARMSILCTQMNTLERKGHKCQPWGTEALTV